MKSDPFYPEDHVEHFNEEILNASDSSSDETLVAEVSGGPAQKKGKVKEPSTLLSEFNKNLEEISDAEHKVRFSLQFMKESLAQPVVPRFRDFWEARKICLPFFKEAIPTKARTELWQEYVDLSTEARRLKDLLDEQSAFAYEQIDLAIEALVKDVGLYPSILKSADHIQIPSCCTSLKAHHQEYLEMQKELTILNSFASKINSLRKEVIRTEMRIKNKNKLFERLSKAGDHVFPKRKSLIKSISEMFISDVGVFVKSFLEKELSSLPPLHLVRDEIKSLQSIAKDLTLNAQAFNDTRIELSKCWDRLKAFDKERKKEMSAKKQQMRRNFEQVLERVQSFSQFCLEMPSASDVTEKYDEVLKFMKSLELSFQEQKTLKDELYQARKPILERERQAQIEREAKDLEIANAKKLKIEEFKKNVESTIHQSKDLNFDQLQDRYSELLSEASEIVVAKSDKFVVDKLFKTIKDLIDEKKRHKLMSLSESDQEKLSELQHLLKDMKERRLEIRAQIESYRKILGGSGFDFEKAMAYRELIEAEKLSLEKINKAIEEVELKVAEVEG